MQIDLPDEVVRAAGLTEKACLTELAVQLYASRRVTIAQALELCRMTRSEFQKELGKREISLYTVEDLHADMAALEELYGS